MNIKTVSVFTIVALISIFTFLSQVNAQSCPSDGKIISCCDLTESGVSKDNPKVYTLQNPVTSDGSCFGLDADNIVLDLNGQTVNYANNGRGFGLDLLSSWHQNIEIKNGSLIGGHFQESHAISFWEDHPTGVNIHDLQINNGGPFTNGIYMKIATDVEIHDVDMVMASTRPGDAACTHASPHQAGIDMNGVGGKIKIYNNTFRGTGMFGISIGECGNWEANQPMEIYNNHVRMDALITDGYGIAIQANNKKCSDGTKIYNNIIDQLNGRGIIVAGWNGPSDIGPSNVEIYNNSVFAQEGSTCENSGVKGNTNVTRFRYGSSNVNMHHNYLYGYAGTDAGIDHNPLNNAFGGTAVGINATTMQDGNVFEENYIKVETNDAEIYATGLYIAGFNNNYAGRPRALNNVIESNFIPLNLGGSPDGGYHYSTTSGGKIIRGSNPLGFESVAIGDYMEGSKGVEIIDVKGEAGADVHDVHFHGVNFSSDFYDTFIKWTLKVLVTDPAGNRIPGAEVTAVSDSGPVTLFEPAEYDGLYSGVLLEKEYYGPSEAESNSYLNYDVFVTANGKSAEYRDIYLIEPGFIRVVVSDVSLAASDESYPIVYDIEPFGILPPESTTEPAYITFKTDESAYCKFAKFPGQTYSSMTDVTVTDGLDHSLTLSDLENGKNYSYYIKCQDSSGNINSADDTVSFWVAHARDFSGTVNDETPPVAVGDLIVNSCGVTACTLSWTAPGDDGGSGAAFVYDIRYSNMPITDSSWNSSTQVTGEPAPFMAGVNQTMTVNELEKNTLYFFAIKTADEVYNWSSISNNVSAQTQEDYMCGDVDNDGDYDLADIMYLIAYIFEGGPAPLPLFQGDTNGDGLIDISDIIFFIDYLYKEGYAPQCLVPDGYVGIGLDWSKDEVMLYLDEAMGNTDVNPQIDGETSGYRVLGGCGNVSSPKTHKLPMSFVLALSLIIAGIFLFKIVAAKRR